MEPSSCVRRPFLIFVAVVFAHFFAMPVKRTRSNGPPEMLQVRCYPPEAKRSDPRSHASCSQESKVDRRGMGNHQELVGMAADHVHETA
eukprot:scaffold207_cov345-Pavlova_lutheri.AAC.43